MRLSTFLQAILARSGRTSMARLAGVALACGLLFGCSGGGGETSGGGGGGGTPSFGLTLGQSSGATAAGQNLALNVQVQPTAGFSSAISLSALNLPGGVSASFSPNPLTPGTQAAACTFTVGAGAAAVNAHPVQVQASGGGVTRTATYALTITAPVQGFSLTLDAPAGTLGAGGTLSTGVTLAAQNGFTGAVTLAATGLPAGVQASFLPAAVNLPAASTATLVLTAAAGVVPATAQAISVQATSGSLSRTATFLLTLTNPNAPGFAMAVNAEAVLLNPGASRDLLVTLTPRNGYTGTVALSTSGLPAGVAPTFLQPALALGASPVSTTLRLVAAGSASVSGPATVTVSAQGPGASAVASLSVQVVSGSDPVAQRQGAIAAVEAKSRELLALKPTPMAYLQSMAAFMAARPEYKEAGVDPDTLCAWGVFQDGTFHGVAANREPDPNPFPTIAGPELEFAAGAFLAKPTARLFHTFGSGFEGQQPIADMRGYLQGRGWTVRPGAEGVGTVETFKGVAGDGFLYVNTHGGRIVVKGAGEPEDKMYAIQTSTLVSADNDRLYDADLKAFRLGPFTAANGETVTLNGQDVQVQDTRYALTYRFVQAYMSFTPGSVVWMNACWSGRNTPFITAFLNKGASVYFGWSEKLSAGAAYASAPYFVDRMLGANKHKDKESPAQRAFPWDLVLQDMTRKGLDRDLATGGKLAATSLAVQLPALFAPSIRRLEVDESSDKLIVHGEFGTDPGKVTVGGTELAAQWAADKLTCTLPQTGPGSAGDVLVEVKSVKSNARQLTEWAVPVTYTWVNPGGSTGLRWDGSGTLRFRADIAGYRLKPGEAPEFKQRGGLPTKDSKLTVTASGSHNDGSCTQTYSGTGVYVSPAQLGGNTGTMIASAFRIDGKTRQAFLGMGFGFVDSPHKVTLTGQDCSGSFPVAPSFGFMDGITEFPWDQSEDPPVGLILGSLGFTLDGNFGIPAKTKTATDFGGTLTVTLGATPAKFPPRDGDDAGR